VSRLSHLPVRIRVTLAFGAAMAVVLGATGLFLYLRLDSELNATIDQGLRSRADDIAALLRTEPAESVRGRGPVSGQGESLAQIMDSNGRILDASAGLTGKPLLRGGELRQALRRRYVFERDEGADFDRARFLARPLALRDRRLVVIVGAPLTGREDALQNLQGLLLIGLPGALLLALAAGYAATAAALRPVEQMRRRATEIGATEPGHRLPVPPAHDEIGRLGATLNQMLSRLEGALTRERQLVSDASHELRTPLAILKSELELALRGGRTVEELELALRSAAEETDRLTQLTEDLLIIASSDEEGLPVNVSQLHAAELLQRVHERFRRRAGERGATLAVESAPGLTLMADPLRLEQALGNLVDNALRYGGDHIRLVARHEGARTALHVVDDGAGFPDDFVAEAFQRFTRADQARGRGGAGLGLAIVAVIARAHGGTVGARNREQGGADVWLEVPR
jgi:signal transduction histidine kinase